jgi:hypothetical protein
MRTIAALAWGLAACGRYGFQPSDALSSQATVVQHGQPLSLTGVTTLTATLTATRAGSAVIVGVVTDSPNASVLSIGDGGDAFVSASVRAVATGCNVADLWYVPGARGGATSVTVRISVSTPFAIWVLELAGVSATAPRVGGMQASAQPAATLIAAPALTVGAGTAVISIAGTCSSIAGVHFGTPFVGLPPSPDGDVAYDVPIAGGSYGATWDATSGGWCGATVAFR